VEKNRVAFVDGLRILSIFAVVVVHICADGWGKLPVSDPDWRILNIFASSVRWCVPLFVMISGIFMLKPDKQISVRSIWSKYILRMVVALFFWGTLYFAIKAPAGSFRDTWSLANVIFTGFTSNIFGATHYHLWYLYMIIGLYALTPSIRIFVKGAEKKDLEYLIILFTIFSFVITLANIFLTQLNIKPIIILSIPEFSGFVCYYITGYYLYNFGLPRNIRITLYVFAASSFFLTVFGTQILSQMSKSPFFGLHGYLLPSTMLEACAIFVLFREMKAFSALSDKGSSFLGSVSSLVFGIYLIHPVFVSLVWKLGLSTSSFFTPLDIIALSLGVFLLSLATVAVLRKLGPWARYVL